MPQCMLEYNFLLNMYFYDYNDKSNKNLIIFVYFRKYLSRLILEIFLEILRFNNLYKLV